MNTDGHALCESERRGRGGGRQKVGKRKREGQTKRENGCVCVRTCVLSVGIWTSSTRTYPHTDKLARFLFLFLSLTLSHTHNLSLSHTHTRTHTVCLSRSLTISLSHTRVLHTRSEHSALYVCSDSCIRVLWLFFFIHYHSLMCAVVRGLKRVRYTCVPWLIVCTMTHCYVPWLMCVCSCIC